MDKTGRWTGRKEGDPLTEHERNKRIRVVRERKLRKELRHIREDADEGAAALLRRLRG